MKHSNIQSAAYFLTPRLVLVPGCILKAVDDANEAGGLLHVTSGMEILDPFWKAASSRGITSVIDRLSRGPLAQPTGQACLELSTL